MTKTVMVAARPGVFSGSFVSSFIVSVTSQPQNMKMDKEMPAAMREKLPISSGLNHETEIGVKSNPPPL